VPLHYENGVLLASHQEQVGQPGDGRPATSSTSRSERGLTVNSSKSPVESRKVLNCVSPIRAARTSYDQTCSLDLSKHAENDIIKFIKDK